MAALGAVFLAYLVGYPFVQAYVLLRGRGWVRTAGFVCLVPMGLFYGWTLFRVAVPSDGDLWGVLVILVSPFILLIMAGLASSCAAQGRKAARAAELAGAAAAQSTQPEGREATP